tara:strand:+ start:269 stop:847 length:579 start_codon:yes stop_codon:yes gene_type:complete
MIVIQESHLGIGGPLAIFSILVAMVYAGGPISGGHYNPVVTMAFYFNKSINLFNVFYYLIVQLMGASLAAFTVFKLSSISDIKVILPDCAPAFFSEFIFTFALVWVILHVAVSKRQKDTFWFGLAIGAVVFAGIISVGTISGGFFNPVVYLGLALIGKVSFSYWWIYLLAQILGGITSSVIFKYIENTYEPR